MTAAALAGNFRSPAARLSCFYAASFLVVGIQLPFWPLWLAGRGLGAQEIALVFAAAIWTKVFAAPAIGALADRFGRRRGVMVALAGVACAGYLGLWPAAAFGAILLGNLVAGVAQSSLMPLGDSITLAAVRETGLDYGRVRVWGSVSFIVAAVAGGAALQHVQGAAWSNNAVLLLVLAASAVLMLTCLGMPQTEAPPGSGRPRWRALSRLAGDHRFWLFVISAAAVQSSHQLYYGFGTLYWRTLGFSDRVIGVLWAEGVVAEIVLFWFSAPLATRLGPLGLMMLGGGAGVVRWSLMGLAPGLAAATVLQLLHALTFGATHLGAMHFMARRVPPGAAASAQSLYAGLSAGFGSGLVMLAAGALYAAYGGGAYPFMAVLSAAGLCGVLCLRRSERRDREASDHAEDV